MAVNLTNNAFETNFLFKCQVREMGLLVTKLANRIMGMLAHPSMLSWIIYYHSRFSMCF